MSSRLLSAWGPLDACAPETLARLEAAALPLGHPAGAALATTGWVASAEALTSLEGSFIPVPAFQEALAMDHGFTTAVLVDLAASYAGTIRVSRAMGFDGCEQRLIRVLLEYAAHFGRPSEEGLVIRYPLSRQRLALEIGAARRSVDRALAALAEENLLSLSPKGWRVLHGLDELSRRCHSALQPH
jgi:hypothetical protein